MTKNIAKYGLLTALAIILGYVEFLIPVNLGIPGTKLGIANIAVIFSLYLLGRRGAFLISMVRIIISGLLFGGVFSMLYSLGGGILSFAVMALLYKNRHLSSVGVSIAGGACHNIGQLVVAVLVANTPTLFSLFPWLVLVGAVTGAVNGVLTLIILRRTKGIDFFRNIC